MANPLKINLFDLCITMIGRFRFINNNQLEKIPYLNNIFTVKKISIFCVMKEDLKIKR